MDEDEANTVEEEDKDVQANANIDEPNAVEDAVANAVLVEDESVPAILTMHEYWKVFAKQNKNHGTTKIPHSNPPMSFIRSRSKMPSRGRPALYVAEGVQCQNVKAPRLLCPGRTGTTKFFENGKVRFVVLGIIWVSLF